MTRPTVITLAAILLSTSCGNKGKESASTAASASVSATPAVASAAPAASGTPPLASAPAAAAAPSVPAGSPPADGKYERVTVEGTTVPMIQVMDNGATVLVDTDGKKPRTWEEQYKRKRPALLAGQYDLHKTNTNKNDSFTDDAIDKEGLWVIDAKGNISKH